MNSVLLNNIYSLQLYNKQYYLYKKIFNKCILMYNLQNKNGISTPDQMKYNISCFCFLFVFIQITKYKFTYTLVNHQFTWRTGLWCVTTLISLHTLVMIQFSVVQSNKSVYSSFLAFRHCVQEYLFQSIN